MSSQIRSPESVPGKAGDNTVTHLGGGTHDGFKQTEVSREDKRGQFLAPKAEFAWPGLQRGPVCPSSGEVQPLAFPSQGRESRAARACSRICFKAKLQSRATLRKML